jgi:threonylcarbamoyladenosine tRNA methylthiotransferase MtaB
MKKISFYNIGCKVNYSDLSSIRDQFSRKGYDVVEYGNESDIVLINTCTVTQNADSDARKIIRRTRRNQPDAFIGVLGCYAQLKPGELSQIEGIDAIFGTAEKFHIPEYIESIERNGSSRIFCSGVDILDFESSFSGDSDSRTRAIIKLQDGCDYNCSYCTIPLARGKSRSMDFDKILPAVDELAKSGYKEIVLSGINLGEYRAPTGESFEDLLGLLSANDNGTRYRISSIEPNLVTQKIINTVAESVNICHHFHIPLQSGSPEILKLMRRRYKSSRYESFVHEIKDRIPDACIGGDVITGFPGESPEHFDETYTFIEKLPMSYLHVFSYSERDNTDASKLVSKVSTKDKSYRTNQLRLLSDSKRIDFIRTQIGKEQTVIAESWAEETKLAEGWSGNYVRIQVRSDENIYNQTCNVLLNSHAGQMAQGIIL